MHDDFFLPPEYLFIDDAEARERIRAHRTRRGDELAIWSHPFQRASVTEHADVVGDGVALARHAARGSTAKFVVCCSVRYVAENARLLLAPQTRVLLPEADAGCPMAAELPLADLDLALAAIHGARSGARVVPLVSVTATVDVKARCGELGGATVGSSNATTLLRWALEQGEVVLFHGDRPLALMAARELGLESRDVATWSNAAAPSGDELRRARLVVATVRCPVHAQVRTEDVIAMRSRHPAARVLVQRELPPEVVALADAAGSISDLADAARRTAAGSVVAIGSETHAVEAIARSTPGRTIVPLATTFCATMYMIHPANVLYTLDRLDEQRALPIEAALAGPARRALERMLLASA